MAAFTATADNTRHYWRYDTEDVIVYGPESQVMIKLSTRSKSAMFPEFPIKDFFCPLNWEHTTPSASSSTGRAADS